MIIIEFMGGLGNQLYQYALYKKLKNLGKTVKMDCVRFDDSTVGRKDKRILDIDKMEGVEYDVCSLKERSKYIDDKNSFLDRVRRKFFGRRTVKYEECKLFDSAIFEKDDIYLSGFFQYYEYFIEVLVQLRKEISIPKSTDKRNSEVENVIKNTESISIHVRRGDYLEEKNQKIFGAICTKEYYEAAVSEIMKTVENPRFYIFSDDAEYIKQYVFGIENVTIVDWNNTSETNIFDMHLMSMCKHNICANSTFSIWAAMFNKNEAGIKIRPMRSNNIETQDEIKMKILQPEWIFLDQEGKR